MREESCKISSTHANPPLIRMGDLHGTDMAARKMTSRTLWGAGFLPVTPSLPPACGWVTGAPISFQRLC